MPGKVFDLHFEIGTNGPPHSNFYARVMLGPNGVIFQHDASTPAAAISKIVIDMETSGMWAVLAKNPGISTFPAGAATPNLTVSTKKADPNAPKQLPSDLTQEVYPDCTGMCTSFEFFGKNKCAGMCQQRHGV